MWARVARTPARLSRNTSFPLVRGGGVSIPSLFTRTSLLPFSSLLRSSHPSVTDPKAIKCQRLPSHLSTFS